MKHREIEYTIAAKDIDGTMVYANKTFNRKDLAEEYRLKRNDSNVWKVIKRVVKYGDWK